MKIIKHNVATVYSTIEIITIGLLIFYRLGGSLSLSTAQVVNNVNPLSLLGAARVADSVDDVVEAGSQVGVAAVRGTSPTRRTFNRFPDVDPIADPGVQALSHAATPSKNNS